MKLSGLNAIVTGASQGLGLEIARAFVREGASVALCARDAAKLDAAASELHALAQPGQKVVALACDVSDPSAPPLPADLAFIQFKPSAAAALEGADAVVVCTEWPEFRGLDWPALLPRLRRPLVIDATRFLEKALAGQPQIQYVTVGSPA